MDTKIFDDEFVYLDLESNWTKTLSPWFFEVPRENKLREELQKLKDNFDMFTELMEVLPSW